MFDSLTSIAYLYYYILFYKEVKSMLKFSSNVLATSVADTTQVAPGGCCCCSCTCCFSISTGGGNSTGGSTTLPSPGK